VARAWRVRELHTPDVIRPYLERDRLYAAYALGDLEPHLFPLCRWWLAEAVAESDDAGWALILCFVGLNPPAVVCLGHASGVGLLLAEAGLPDQVFLVCQMAHLPAAQESFDVPSPQHMVRLALESERFRPAPTGEVIRLSPADLDAVQVLYAAERGAADAFAAYQLADGVFFGVRVEGRLISVAGTHLVAPGEGIGAVGNVFTHPAHRRRGYAAACTSAVCADLLGWGMTVVLNVNTRNLPALRLYQRLGFREHCTYYEATATRRDRSPAGEPVG
jgi:ribosomal protein S18 acetylase RimI-like enzyme